MSESAAKQEKVEDEADEESTHQFFQGLGISKELPESSTYPDFWSHLIGGVLNVHHISRAQISCSFTVIPCITNYFNGLHGGAVAAVAERVAIACARTVVAEDKQLFLGELSVSYLSAASINVELVANASLVRSGRNISVVSIEIKHKLNDKLVYTGQATFYHLPASRL